MPTRGYFQKKATLNYSIVLIPLTGFKTLSGRLQIKNILHFFGKSKKASTFAFLKIQSIKFFRDEKDVSTISKKKKKQTRFQRADVDC
jgi:hypothetical protein